MNTIAKAFVIIALSPLALCVGVYGCTAAHVAIVQQAVTPAPTADSIVLRQLPADAVCCTRSGLAYDAHGNHWQRYGNVWVKP